MQNVWITAARATMTGAVACDKKLSEAQVIGMAAIELRARRDAAFLAAVESFLRWANGESP